MKRIGLIVGLLAAVVLVPSSTAQAGESAPELQIEYIFVGGIDPTAAANAFTPELFEGSGTDVSSLCSKGAVSPSFDAASVTSSCTNITPDTYVVGGTNLGTYTVAAVTCTTSELQEQFTDPDATFTWSAATFAGDCFVTLVSPTVNIDVLVNNTAGGTATPSNFTVEAYATDGGAVVGTGTDPAATTCSSSTTDGTACARLALAPGSYILGITPRPGYVPSGVNCVPVELPDEQLPAAGASFVHSAEGGDTYCTITMTYTTQTVSADIVVVNDNGGTAAGSAFTIEVYDATNTLVDSGIDPAPGTGNASFVSRPLPVGTYSLGVAGPTGYTYTVVVTAIDQSTDSERFTDPSAAFTLGATRAAAAVITANDPPPAPTTTAAPPATTAAPTGVLPATGTASSTLLLWALAALVLGAGTVLVTRRA